MDAVPAYDALLEAESEKQQNNEELRIAFAEKANSVGTYIEQRSAALAELSMQGQGTTMEDQLEALKAFQAETLEFQPEMDAAETCNQVRRMTVNFTRTHTHTQALEAAIVFDNSHTEYNMESLRSGWALLMAAVSRALNETQNQILIRDSKGLSESQLSEYRQSFNHFDKVLV